MTLVPTKITLIFGFLDKGVCVASNLGSACHFLIVSPPSKRQECSLRANSSSASLGPSEPAGYFGISPMDLRDQASSNGWTSRQPCSTNSALGNRNGSPNMASRKGLS